MNSFVRGYLLAVIAAAFLSAVISAVFPKGGAKQRVQFVCGLLVILVVAGPFAKMDAAVLPQAIARSVMEAEQTRNRVRLSNRELTATVIKQNTEAYILDKAAQMKLTLRAEVTMAGDETYPYPAEVTITSNATAAEQRELTEWISRELGIPTAMQKWVRESSKSGK